MSSLERLASGTAAEAPPAPLRGRRHGEDRLHLLVRDPKRVFVAWEISPDLASRSAARAAAARALLRYQIVLERAAREGEEGQRIVTFDLPDALGGEGWYLDLPRSGGFARASLGLDLPGGFVPLLTSRWAAVPPDGPCAEEGGWEVDPASAAWLERQMERRDRVPGSPPALGARAPAPRQPAS